MSSVHDEHEVDFHAGVAPGASMAYARQLLRMVRTRGLCSGHLGPTGTPKQVPSKGRLHAGLPEGEIRELTSANRVRIELARDKESQNEFKTST